MIWSILLPIFMILTAVALAYGLYTMIKGGKYTGAKANKAMQWRIGLQFVAIMIAIAIVTSISG